MLKKDEKKILDAVEKNARGTDLSTYILLSDILHEIKMIRKEMNKKDRD